jgi:DNA adenine methylase
LIDAAGEALAERGRLTPFLKWVGGKARYCTTLAALAPRFTGCYREPFMGSAAVFFEMHPAAAMLSDANAELIVCFQQVAADPHAVMAALDRMPNTREFHDTVRRQHPADLTPLQRAARVIYLNKTSFRGLWRVNKRDEFNTPWGAYDRPYYNRHTLLDASRALTDVALACIDFETALDMAQSGDWTYLDPPYVPLGGQADFKRYTALQFTSADHVRLCEAMRRATARGVYVTMTNSDVPFVRELFGPHFEMRQLTTRRDINLRAAARASSDLVVTNYTPQNHDLTRPPKIGDHAVTLGVCRDQLPILPPYR